MSGAEQIIRGPGRLIVGPSNLQLDVGGTLGGTAVGRTRAVVLRSMSRPFRITTEGLGGEASDIIEPTPHYVFSCFLRGWNNDAIASFFASNYYQGISGQAQFTEPGSRAAGKSAFARAVSLLYLPDDPVNVPSMLLPRAVPYWGEGAEVAWQRAEELGLPILCECLRDDNGRMVQIGRLGDLTLA